jgi:hypothetical protein
MAIAVGSPDLVVDNSSRRVMKNDHVRAIEI